MTKVSKKVKILTILPSLNIDGGMQSYVMNYYNEIHNSIKMDFIYHKPSDNYFKNIIKKNGDKSTQFLLFNIKNLKENIELIKEYLKENHDYDIIHCHMANAAYFYFKEAKKYGIKVRIIHSHQDKYADKFSHSLRNIPLVKLGLKYSNYYFACSKRAGDFLFKKRNYFIINNAINTKRFEYNSSVRKKIRKELKIDEFFVVGSVGRMNNQKNQMFLIDIISELKNNINCKLLLVGKGPLKDKLINYSIHKGVKDKVLFIEPTSDIEKYYQAMDYFVLPSHYEGLGIVNIEAQCSGLKTLVSSNVPEEARVSSLIHFMDLNLGASSWANYILETKDYKRENHSKDIIKSGYDLSTESEKLLNLYNELSK